MARNDFDLPDPQPHRTLSEAEYRARRFSLYRNLFILSVLYGTLHKVFIPLILSQTSVLVRDYTVVDLWAIPGLVLAFYFFRYKKFDARASLLAGALVGYALWDTRAVFSGQHRGWLAWSHAISSIPQGIMSVALLSSQQKTRSLSAAWIGAALALILLFVLAPKPAGTVAPQVVHPLAHLPELAPNACGAQEFLFPLSTIKEATIIELRACGFAPAALLAKADTNLRLVKSTQEMVNIHILFFGANGVRRRQSNRILKPNATTIPLPELKFEPTETAAVLYSDSAPQLGKVVIVNDQSFGDYRFAGVTPSRALVWSKDK